MSAFHSFLGANLRKFPPVFQQLKTTRAEWRATQRVRQRSTKFLDRVEELDPSITAVSFTVCFGENRKNSPTSRSVVDMDDTRLICEQAITHISSVHVMSSGRRWHLDTARKCSLHNHSRTQPYFQLHHILVHATC